MNALTIDYMAKFQETSRREDAVRSEWEYNVTEWLRLLDDEVLSPDEISRRVNVTTRHVHNILDGTTRTCRHKTKKKMTISLLDSGVPQDQIDKLFRRARPSN